MKHGRTVMLALVVLFVALTGFWLFEGRPVRAGLAVVNATIALLVYRNLADAPRAV